MTDTVSIGELREQWARVIKQVEAGNRFIITRNGESVAEIHPVSAVGNPANGTKIRMEDIDWEIDTTQVGQYSFSEANG